MAPSFGGPARIGVAAELLLTGLLTAFLVFATDDHLDAVPRPLVLAVLLATPALIAAIGIYRRRRSLLVSAAVPLIPASILSFALVTLPYGIVAILYLAGAGSAPATSEPRGWRVVHGIQALAVAGLILAAGWVVLFAMTRNTCVSDPSATACGDGVISSEGVVTMALLLAAAIALAAVGRRPRTRA